MRINHNIPALQANNQLGKTNSGLDQAIERLSSGYRINSAADDAAGLAISQKMDTQIRGLEQASRNANDGISVIQTAEGALGEVHSMLQRIRELAVQVSNGTYDSIDRGSVQDEVNQLAEEIQRISDTTEFNERKLLNGEIDRRAYSNQQDVTVVSLSDTVPVSSYSIKVTADARKAVLTSKTAAFKDTATPQTDYVLSEKITAAGAGTININGEEVKIVEGDTAETVFSKLRTLCETVRVDISYYASGDDASDTNNASAYEFNDAAPGRLKFESKDYGSNQYVEIHCSSAGLESLLGLKSADHMDIRRTGNDVKAEFPANRTGFENTATISTDGNMVTVSDKDGFEMKFEIAEGSVGTKYQDTVGADGKVTTTATGGTTINAKISVLDAGPMDLQIGANEGQFMEVRIPAVTPKSLGIDNINLATADGAQIAIGKVDDAVNMISKIRSKLGAYQNRLEHSISNLDTTAENMTSSMSGIQDTDMASEMAEYTQKNVLTQAGTSMLTKATQRPDTILQLLQG